MKQYLKQYWTYGVQGIGILVGGIGVLRRIDRTLVACLAVGAALWLLGWFLRNKLKL